MASVRVIGYSTVVVSFSNLKLPVDAEIGNKWCSIMVRDIGQSGVPVQSWHYDPENMKLTLVFEDRRDALYIAFTFRNAITFYLTALDSI